MRIDHELDPADAIVVEEIRQHAAPAKGKLLRPDAETRAAFDAMMLMTPAADGARFEPGTVGGVPGLWVRVANPGGVILHIHGGGNVVGSARGHSHFSSHIATRAGMDVFLPDYRLAPEHPFPAGQDDAQAAFDALPGAIVVGDSAGGALALGIRGADKVVALSPRTDYTGVDHAENDDLYLTADGLRITEGLYLNGADGRLASPVFGPLAPRVLVHVGTCEVLLDDSLRLADRAEVHVWKGMPHVFPGTLQLKAAHLVLDHIAAFIRS